MAPAKPYSQEFLHEMGKTWGLWYSPSRYLCSKSLWKVCKTEDYLFQLLQKRISDFSKTQMFLMLVRKQMWLKLTSGMEKNTETTKKIIKLIRNAFQT
jgi:hypothetical protein